MKIYSVLDKEFAPYGQVLGGYDTAELIDAMNAIDLPEEGKKYQASIPSLENCSIFKELGARAYGGMPIELGMCWGRNTKLNGLEYHKNSEINVGTDDFVLLIAKKEDIIDGKLDTSKVKAFRVIKGLVVEVYATTLHYAPCHLDEKIGFRCAVALPAGTNGPIPEFEAKNDEDRRMRACNKWLLAHPESSQAKKGAYIGLVGKNIDITVD